MNMFLFWQIFVFFCCIIGSICGMIALYVSVNVWVQNKAMQLSTHQVQMVPVEVPKEVEEKIEDYNRSSMLEEDELHNRF